MSCAVRFIQPKAVAGEHSPRLRSLARRLAKARVCALIAVFLMVGAAQARAQLVLVVNTLADSNDGLGSCFGGNCSLRDAILQANADFASSSNADTITFQENVIGTITLTSSLPEITGPVSISGPGAYLLTVSGANQYAIFTMLTPADTIVSISGLTIANGNNSAGGGLTIGGGANPSGSLTISNCTITDNTGVDGGGIYSNNAGPLDIYGSTIAGNTASAAGGGIYSVSGVAVVVESTITGNTATSGAGGGIDTGTGTAATVVNSTVTGNTAGSAGGGIESVVAPTINNSIVAGNTTNGTADSDDCHGCGTQPANNLIGGTPPTLGPLAWNGGMTQTMIPLPGSTAICTGLESAAINDTYANPPPLTTDQRGFYFVPNHCGQTGFSYSDVDLGAVQTNYLTVNTLSGTSASADCYATGPSGNCSLTDAMTVANNDEAGDIVFASSLFPSNSPETITVAAPLQEIFSETGVNLEGPGQSILTISGGGTQGPIFASDAGGIVNITGVTIANGYAPNTSIFPGGGGIYNNGELTLINSTLSGNQAQAIEFGGGLYNDENPGMMLLSGDTIAGNSVTVGSPPVGGGGGVYNDGQMVMLDTTVSGNSVAAGNSSLSAGGGIFQDSPASAMVMINSTVSGNSAIQGGGIFNDNTLTVLDSTISNNTALTNSSNGGGGIDNEISGVADGYNDWMTLSNSIVAGNVNNGSPDCYNCAPNSTSSYNNIDAVTMTSGSPQLGALQVNGVNTSLQTMLPLPGSPAIGAGLTSEIPIGLTTDERGYPRTTGGKLDLGAAQTNYTAIEFYQQPSNTLIDTDITPAPSVEVLESNGTSTDAVSGIPITLTYSDAPNMTGIPGTPTDTIPTVVGSNTIPLATFGSLEPTAAATGVTLTASAGTLSTQSNPFNVYLNITQLAFLTPPATPILAGGNAGASVQVEEENGSGQLVTTGSDIITLAVSGPSGYTATYMATAVNGIATYNLSGVALVAGSYTYTASIASNNAVTPAVAYETVEPLDFTVTISGAGTVTVIPGSAAVYDLIVSPTNTLYPGTVTFAVTGLPEGATATFAPMSIPSNGGTQTVVMTVQTEPFVVRNESLPGGPAGMPWTLALLLLPLAGARRLRRGGRRLNRLMVLTLALAGGLAGAMALSGCTNGNHNGFFLTGPTSNILTVTGTSGGLHHSVTVTLNQE